MARPVVESLQYFPLDVDIFDDPKLLFVAEKFGEDGEIVAIKLLCWIYRNGYYCEWDKEHSLIFARKTLTNIKSDRCDEIVNELLERGFFNKKLFQQHGILSSKAIQSRWQRVIDDARRRAEIKMEFNLLMQEETPPKPTLTPSEEEETPSKTTETTQSIVQYLSLIHI